MLFVLSLLLKKSEKGGNKERKEKERKKDGIDGRLNVQINGGGKAVHSANIKGRATDEEQLQVHV